MNDVISETRLQAEAGDRAFVRGTACFDSGAVIDLVVSGETIHARVTGGDEYAVQLWNEDGEIGYSCTCPVGDDGVFCKHGVAAGLAWLAKRQGTPPTRRGKDDLAGIREWLAAAPREKLEELLLEQALDDPALRGRLDAQAARIALDLARAREAINALKARLMERGEATPLFGQERNKRLAGIPNSIGQTFDGQPLYPSIEEKAVPPGRRACGFADGNKLTGGEE